MSSKVTASIASLPVETLREILLCIDPYPSVGLEASPLVPSSGVSRLWRLLAVPELYRRLWVRPCNAHDACTDDPVPDFVAPYLEDICCYLPELPALQYLSVETPRLFNLSIGSSSDVKWDNLDLHGLAVVLRRIPNVTILCAKEESRHWIPAVLTEGTRHLSMRSVFMRHSREDVVNLAPNLESLYLDKIDWKETSKTPTVLRLPSLHSLAIVVHDLGSWQTLRALVLGARQDQLLVLEVGFDYTKNWEPDQFEPLPRHPIARVHVTTLLCAVDVASHLGRYALSALSGVLSETLELNLLYSVGRQETLRQHDLDIWRVPECVEQCSVFIGVTMRGVPPAPPIGRGHGFGVEEHPMRTMFRRARKTFGRSVEFEYEYVEEEEEDERAIWHDQQLQSNGRISEVYEAIVNYSF